MKRAPRAQPWPPPPRRAQPPRAFGSGGAHVWEAGAVARHAGVLRFCQEKKPALAALVRVTTAPRRTAKGSGKH